MRTAKGLYAIIAVIFILNIMSVQITPGAQIDDIEQRLIEEILTLDSKVLALQKEVDKLSSQNQELKEELKQKKEELSSLNSSINIRQNELSRWVIFSYKGGLGNMLAVLVGAEDFGDFFRRFDNIMFFLEYYNNIILETRSLYQTVNRRKRNIMEKQRKLMLLNSRLKKPLRN